MIGVICSIIIAEFVGVLLLIFGPALIAALGEQATSENGRAASVPNVTFNVTEGYVTIEPREVTLTSGSASKKRDGTPLTELRANPS